MPSRAEKDRASSFLQREKLKVASRNRQILSSIPEEVLVHIFSYLPPKPLAISNDPLPNVDWHLHDRRRHDDLIAVTHVCRAWRQICLSTPSFWNLVWISDDDVSRSRAQKLIERSGNRPMEIAVRDEEAFFRCHQITPAAKKRHITGPLLEPVLALRTLFPQGPLTIKTVRISSPFKLPPGEHQIAFFSMPAPLLSSFVLSIATHRNDVDWPIFQLPSPLFAGHTPKLRKLGLLNVDVPWNSSMFKNLSTLRIECTEINHRPNPIDSRVDVHRLLEIIHDCPHLITLVLIDVGPISSTPTLETKSSQVIARHLTNMRIEVDWELAPFHSFLDNLHSPILRHCYISHDQPCVTSIHEMLPTAFLFDSRTRTCNCLDAVVRAPTFSVVLNHFMVEDLDAKFSNTENKVSLQSLIQESSFKSHIRLGNDIEGLFRADSREIYSQFLQSAFLRFNPAPENIRAICLRVEIDLDDPWRMSYEELFRIYHNVEFVEVRGLLDDDSLDGFTGFLRRAVASSELHESGHAFPSVRKLIFANVEFLEHEVMDLRVSLVHRKTRKSPLLFLGFYGCSGVRAEISTLEELVETLFVDEAGGIWDDDEDEDEYDSNYQ
ncbi:hypothetical protein SCHPADRAFT_938483 [Schizopora paradoxa]|uniref:Uncharacterized protein n=1 Tax=Schizopora paradoxa TaxID=27342 RepID=A0A0H2S1W3_9AGAM|nr:hypothetical protein SCHPADRAFT_938483 [Schizopora paradoxa]